MSVTITLKNTTGEVIASFPAEDFKSISQMAEKHNVEIPISCCMGACYVCACKVKSGSQFIQLDKIMTPAVMPETDDQGNYKDVFTCVSGIKTEYLKDAEQHEVVLEKMI